MADSINDVLAAAKAAATAKQAEQAAAAPAVQATGTAVATQSAAGLPAALSVNDMLSGSFSVDAFLKVNEDGMKIGNSFLIEKFNAVINLSEVFYYFAVKYGNPAKYEKTQNRVKALSGRPWQDVLGEASRVDTKFRGEYRSGDVPMTVVGDVLDMKNAVAAKNGTRVGKSLSTTEWREWETMIRAASKLGIDTQNGSVVVTVTPKKREGNGNKWGVAVFDLVGPYVETEAAAA